MEENGGSPTYELQELLPQRSRAYLVAAPKDYFLGPVFAATKQNGPREVTIGNRSYTIGGFHPIKRNLSPPALDVRHARAIFSLLSFRDPFDDDGTRLIRFSFNEFCRRYANSNGGRYARAIKDILGDLTDAYIRITNVTTGISHSYRLIERVDIEDRPIRKNNSHLATSNQSEMWFNGCTLSPEFSGLLNRITELQHLKLNVFTSIRSTLAQAIYLYIPSRAYHHTASNPFEINATKLLEQVSFPVPFHKSVRKRVFTMHEKEGHSVLQQLDHLETLSGHFRVALVETEDKSDWKLQSWLEKSPSASKPLNGSSKLVAAYLKSGRSQEHLNQALSNIHPLTDYETEMLETAQVEIGKHRRFFEMAKAILTNTRFAGLLAEAKGASLEGLVATKNPTARLIHRIMESISAPIQNTRK